MGRPPRRPRPVVSGPAPAGRCVWRWALGAVVAFVFVAGWFVPGAVECDATQPYPEPGEAVDLSRQFTDGTLWNVLYRKRCVAEVREVPGSCKWSRHAGGDDQVVRIEMYTWGGIARDLYVTCSGASVFPPPGWESTAGAERRGPEV